MVKGEIGIVEGCAELARLRSFHKGYKYIPMEFVGIDSMIDDVKFHYSDSKGEEKAEKERILDLYKKKL